MTKQELIHQATLDGPGLDGYSFQADVWCIDCGETIIKEIAHKVAPQLENTSDPLFSDSETLPQPIFFGEADNKQHCAGCGKFLY